MNTQAQPAMTDEAYIQEQKAYYRARAPEYNEWCERLGRYDRGPAHRRQWKGELAEVDRQLTHAGPFGQALELACGTGLWTPTLMTGADALTAIDASPEAIEINRRHTDNERVRYQVADIFEWDPEAQYDFIFFGFWLSHVPESRFDAFWERLNRALLPQGRVAFVDSLLTPDSTAADHTAPDHSGIVVRKLNNGQVYRVIKHFHSEESLATRLDQLGWRCTLNRTDTFFLHGIATRA